MDSSVVVRCVLLWVLYFCNRLQVAEVGGKGAGSRTRLQVQFSVMN